MSAMLLPILLAAALLLSACASERKQDPALVSDDAAGITEIIRASRAGELPELPSIELTDGCADAKLCRDFFSAFSGDAAGLVSSLCTSPHDSRSLRYIARVGGGYAIVGITDGRAESEVARYGYLLELKGEGEGRVYVLSDSESVTASSLFGAEPPRGATVVAITEGFSLPSELTDVSELSGYLEAGAEGIPTLAQTWWTDGDGVRQEEYSAPPAEFFADFIAGKADRVMLLSIPRDHTGSTQRLVARVGGRLVVLDPGQLRSGRYAGGAAAYDFIIDIERLGADGQPDGRQIVLCRDPALTPRQVLEGAPGADFVSVLWYK